MYDDQKPKTEKRYFYHRGLSYPAAHCEISVHEVEGIAINDQFFFRLDIASPEGLQMLSDYHETEEKAWEAAIHRMKHDADHAEVMASRYKAWASNAVDKLAALKKREIFGE